MMSAGSAEMDALSARFNHVLAAWIGLDDSMRCNQVSRPRIPGLRRVS